MKAILLSLLCILVLLGVGCGSNDSTPTSSSITMVDIPGGTFSMGDNSSWYADVKPAHSVQISAFKMSVTEITQSQWESIMGSNPSVHKGGENPVENITWLQAVEFCNKLSAKDGLSTAYGIEGTTVSFIANANGYRLPTEAEWEYACRAGTTTSHFTGTSETELQKAAWYQANAGNVSHPVGQKIANAFGLKDTHGNVQEWCWDVYRDNYYASSPASNPRGPDPNPNLSTPLEEFRSVRGGCFFFQALGISSPVRNTMKAGKNNEYIGLRIARNN